MTLNGGPLDGHEYKYVGGDELHVDCVDGHRYLYSVDSNEEAAFVCREH